MESNVTLDSTNHKLIIIKTPGGIWSPPHCNARYSTLIIIPYRDREKQLVRLRKRGSLMPEECRTAIMQDIFLRLMHPFLQAQNLSYSIIVIEQDSGVGRTKKAFNRAKLLNVGFIEGFKVKSNLPMSGKGMYCRGADSVCEVLIHHHLDFRFCMSRH